MAATGFRSKVEWVFLVMHVGFVGFYSGNINGVFWGQFANVMHDEAMAQIQIRLKSQRLNLLKLSRSFMSKPY